MKTTITFDVELKQNQNNPEDFEFTGEYRRAKQDEYFLSYDFNEIEQHKRSEPTGLSYLIFRKKKKHGKFHIHFTGEYVLSGRRVTFQDIYGKSASEIEKLIPEGYEVVCLRPVLSGDDYLEWSDSVYKDNLVINSCRYPDRTFTTNSGGGFILVYPRLIVQRKDR